MTQSDVCPRCSAPLPIDAPHGLCPRCLLQAGLDASESVASGDAGPRRSRGFEAPSVETLRAYFPNLEILEFVSKGGMGAVYKAKQLGLDRLTALKILPAETSGDPAFAERFRREARALARLDHPHIVHVYDFGQSGDLYWFLMEYVDGADLRHAMRHGSMSPAEALAVVPQICDALQYAHDEGIVHRDVKPENVLLDRRGRVKIADFGLAKLLGSDPSDGASLTASRQAMGTLRYMSPEQMEGSETIDHRADIYSLGVVFYELLTGEVPAGRFQPPSRKVSIDVRLDEVVMRSLEREPERRWQHASDVRHEIDSIVNDVPSSRQARSQTRATPKPMESSEFSMKTMPQDAADLALGMMFSLFVFIVFFCVPTAFGFLIAVSATGDAFRSAAIAAITGGAVVIGFFLALALGSLVKATIDVDGVTLQRLAGPSKFLAWREILRVRPASRWEVARQVAFWPGLPPRGSILSFTLRDWYRIDSTSGCWYFCPSREEAFRRAVGLDAAGSSAGDARAATMVYSRSDVRTDADSFEPPTTLSWGVYVIATLNLLTALALMFLIAGDPEPSGIPESVDVGWRSWETTSTYLAYAIYAITLPASVGLFLRQPWARSLTIGTCWASLATFATDIPYLARFYMPRYYGEVVSDLIAEGTTPDEAAVSGGLMIFLAYGLGFGTALAMLLFEILYLSRRRIVVRFEGRDGRPAGAVSRALVWAPTAALVAAGIVIFLALQAKAAERSGVNAIEPTLHEAASARS